MSLTEFVSRPEIRDRISEEFPNRGERATEPLKAEWQTQNYMLIGTAFDYLLRFWLRRNIPEYHARPWVAEISQQIGKDQFPEYEGDVQAVITQAKDARDDYIETGEATPRLAEAAMDLARVDAIYRSGETPVNLGEYEKGDAEDCLHLMEILGASNALDGRLVFLNPAFGYASLIVGGADADAILDGALVDVKTTSKATFKLDYWRQLVGYLVLADVHNTFHNAGIYDRLGLERDSIDQRLPEIESFGVYFARHGELSTVPASVIYDAENYNGFRSWFVETALDQYDPFDGAMDELIRMMF